MGTDVSRSLDPVSLGCPKGPPTVPEATPAPHSGDPSDVEGFGYTGRTGLVSPGGSTTPPCLWVLPGRGVRTWTHNTENRFYRCM